MKYLLIIFLFPSVLFGQISFQLELDTFVRTIPDVGFNGNVIRGPGWSDSIFNDSVATMHPEILRYPSGGVADFWDWNTGWFQPQSVLDTSILDTTYVMNSGWYTLDTVDSRPIVFQQALDQIDSEGLYVLNLMSSNVTTQSTALRSAIAAGVTINKVEIGSEFNHGNIFKTMKYPTAGDYARTCNLYIDSVKAIIPNAEIAVTGGNRGADSTRAWKWNDSIYSIVNAADAMVWHCYLYLNDGDTNFTTKQFLAYPHYRVPLYEKWRGFNDTISDLQGYEIWITEYNLFDKTSDKRYTNTWAQVLLLSGMNNEFMKNKLVEMILLHNVGGIFTNFDALDTENNFKKRGTGIFASIWNESIINMNQATRIKTPESLLDSVEYSNNNNVINKIFYPKLSGWKYSSPTNASMILTNISPDTMIISVDSLFTEDVYWEKWTSDSLMTQIDNTTYIKMQLDTGKTNITLLPYSINIAKSEICNHASYFQVRDLCDGDSIFLGGSYQTTSGTYSDTFFSILLCDSIISTTLTINPLPSISLANFNPDSLCANASPVILPLTSLSGGNYSGNSVISGYFNPSSAGIGAHDIIYTYTDSNCCVNSDTIVITVDICTDFGIIVYPNPNTGEFTIEKSTFLTKEVQIKLLDATSKLILEKVIPVGKQKIEIDFINHSKGVYYLHLIIDNEQFVKKILRI